MNNKLVTQKELDENEEFLHLGRKIFQKIVSSCERQLLTVVNPNWIRAYEQLAIAADHLDAMSARCTTRRK